MLKKLSYGEAQCCMYIKLMLSTSIIIKQTVRKLKTCDYKMTTKGMYVKVVGITSTHWSLIGKVHKKWSNHIGNDYEFNTLDLLTAFDFVLMCIIEWIECTWLCVCV